MLRMLPRTMFLGASLAVLLLGCREEPRGEPPPPPPKVATTAGCSPNSAWTEVGLVGVPRETEGFCLDAGTDIRSYGAGTSLAIDRACRELLNGECEVYRAYGLERIRTFAYVDRARPTVRVSVVVTEYGSELGAFGFYTRRVLSGDDPRRSTVRSMDDAGRIALGVGVAYLQRGRQVAELTYVSDTETPDEVARGSESRLLPLSRALASSLGGQTSLPRLAKLVDLPGRHPLGLEVGPDGLFGLHGLGFFAVAHFPDAAVPHRLLALEAEDERAAEDIEHLLKSAGRTHGLKGRAATVLEVSAPEGPNERWLVARRGLRVFGVGPPLASEPRPVGSPDVAKRQAESWDVFALDRLSSLVRHVDAVSHR